MSILARIMGGLPQYVPRRERENISDFEQRKNDFYHNFREHQEKQHNIEQVSENIAVNGELLEENVSIENVRNFNERIVP